MKAGIIAVTIGLAFALNAQLYAAVSDADFKALMNRVAKLEGENAALKAKICNSNQPQQSKIAQTTDGKATTVGDTTRTTSDTTKVPTVSKDSKIAMSASILDVPDSPAAAILGVSPQTVVRPSTPQQFIPAILNGVDEHGNFKSGLAIDVVPYKYFGDKGKKLDDYVDAHPDSLDWEVYAGRVIRRTQLSLATTKGADSKDSSIQLAVGIQATLMDENDPIWKQWLISNTALSDAPLFSQLGKSYDQAEKIAALSNSNYKSWHYNSSWAVGAAQTWISPDGSTGNFKSDGYALYSTYSYGFEGMDAMPGLKDMKGFDKTAQTIQHKAQLLSQLCYRNGEMIPNPSKTGTFEEQDTLEGSLRLRIGEPKLNCSFIETVSDQMIRGGSHKTAYKTAFSVEAFISGFGWLTISMGKEFDNATGKNPILILGGVKLGLTDPRSDLN